MRWVLAVLIAVAMCPLAASTAQAAPVTTPVCDPASAAREGDPASVTIPDDAVFRAGKAVPVQVNDGRVQRPGDPRAFGHVPVCTLVPTEDGRPRDRPEWMFCLEREKFACEDEPGYNEVDGAAYGPAERARFAWVYDHADLATPTGRAEAQAKLWCVTDHKAPNQPHAEAIAYYAQRGIAITGVCPNWPAIDPALPPDPEAHLTGPTDPAPASGTARFTLEATVTRLRLTATGGATLTVCPDSGNGTLDGDVLTHDVKRPVRLCVTRAEPGTVTITAERHDIPSPHMEFWQYTPDPRHCQVLLRREPTPSTVHATATARFIASPTTSVPPSTPTPPATPTTPHPAGHELAATGIGDIWELAGAAAVLLAAGTLLRRLPRRR